MASIVYQIDKKTGIKYAYESISYWDKEKKQPRSKRKYLGKVDPETGEIIPSKKDDSPLKISGTEAEEILRLRTILAENEKRIQTLEKDLREANTKISQQAMRLKEIAALAKY
jgi:predicted aconitase with swiveling domain